MSHHQNATVGTPSRSSSSSRMMIRGVTISIRLLVVRPMPTLRNRRSIIGILDRTGTPYSVRCSFKILTPPRRTVPPSGTVTVVVTVLVVTFGSWMVVVMTAAPPPRPLPPTAPDCDVKVWKPLLALKKGASVIRT